MWASSYFSGAYFSRSYWPSGADVVITEYPGEDVSAVMRTTSDVNCIAYTTADAAAVMRTTADVSTVLDYEVV